VTGGTALEFFGGLGVFFVGMRMLSQGLKRMTGPKLRQLFAKWTENFLATGVLGLVMGFVTQSMSAVSFIVASLAAGRMLTVGRGVLLLAWANVGSAFLVIFAVLDIKSLVFFTLGLTGFSLAFERPARFKDLAYTLFGVGLLFYGLVMIRSAAGPMVENQWASALLSSVRESYLTVFLIGALLKTISQSSAGVGLVAIALAQAGVFDMPQTVMIIYGSNAGSSVLNWLLSMSLKGTPKQLVMSQVYFNLVACAVLLPLFYIEVLGGVPLVMAWVQHFFGGPVPSMAAVFLLFNGVGAVIYTVALGPLTSLFQKMWPPPEEEAWGQLLYLDPEAMGMPEAFAALVEKEQARLVQRLLDILRQPKSRPAAREAFSAVSRELGRLLAEGLGQALNPDTAEQMLNLQNRQNLLDQLEQTISSLTGQLDAVPDQARPGFRAVLVEGLDFLLAQAGQAAETAEPEDVRDLWLLTGDKSETLKRLRQKYLEAEAEDGQTWRLALLEITGHYERAVWMLNHFAWLLSGGAVADGAQAVG